MAGGGVHGKVVGIAHCFITGDGFIITISQVSILMWTQVGKQITETIIGMGIGGTMNGSLTNDFNRTGKTGKRITIGKGKEIGVYGTINPGHNNRDRN
ncbi:MAG: hypothetical protein ACYDH8_09305 [Syntrophales bacterium]|jgi:hypothetical protein